MAFNKRFRPQSNRGKEKAQNKNIHKVLRDIEFGEPDANAEYFMSLRSKVEPMYIRAYHDPDINNYELYLSGAKFIITGYKGTGKTAVLRRMEDQCKKNGYSTEFIVFKSEIIREAELLKVDYKNLTGSVIEEESLKYGKFYYHAVKRVMISLLISKMKLDVSVEKQSDHKDLMVKLFGSSGKDAIRYAFDSILNIIKSMDFDIEKASKGFVHVDPGQLIKKSNDDFLSAAVRLAKSQSIKVRLFFDEMHFAFRDKDSLRSDAALVRDTILVVQALNERFAEEGLDVVVYVALRREFLDQPEIAQADIVHVVESYGEAISWEHYQANKAHPVFDFITLRFRASLGLQFSKSELFDIYMRDFDPIDLLEYTWSRPRDLVRFFKTAQTMFGGSVVINRRQYRAVLRTYSAQAWREAKSALAAFVPTDAIPLLEAGIKSLVPGQYDRSQRLNKSSFQKAVKPAFDAAKQAGIKYDISEFCDILYMMGVFYYTYIDANGRTIFQQYHRGNVSPDQSGEIFIHAAIARALS